MWRRGCCRGNATIITIVISVVGGDILAWESVKPHETSALRLGGLHS